METIFFKDRLRQKRGKLTSFECLPLNHQNNFILIKNKLQEIFGKNLNVYVFGSFYWGSWDDLSDYDVRLEYIHNNYEPDERLEKIEDIRQELTKNLGVKVDVLIMQGDFGILIP